MIFRERVLANGLEVVAECNPEARSTAVGFFVKTGARDEHDAIAGVSHFLEHMMFKGTPTRSAEDVNREFDEMGAHYNAFTSEERTVYYAAVLPEQQDRAVSLLADILRPSLREEDFETEKKVILEEIQMYLDQPPFGADDRVRAAHFGGHPLGRSVLGTLDSVGGLPVTAMREYFERRYSPGNISLVAAGQVDFEELVATAERHCGGWTPFAVERDARPPAPRSGFECAVRETATQEYLLQLANGPAADDPDRYAAKILATIIGDDTGSRLFWELVDPGHAETASLGHYDYVGAGLFIAFMACDPEFAQANLDRMHAILADVEATGVTPEELDQAKHKINSRVVLGSERPRGRLFNLGANWLHRREYRSVKDDLDAVDAVTAERIRKVLSDWPLTRNTAIMIGPARDLRPGWAS